MRTHPYADDPLTRLVDVDLLRVGDRLILAGQDGDTLRWTWGDRDGNLGALQALPLPPRLAGPWVGVMGRALPATGIVAVYTAPSPDDATRTQVLAIAQEVGAAPTAPVKLFETPAGAKADQLRVAVGSSDTGLRAAVAVGFADQSGSPINVYVIETGPRILGDPIQLIDVPKNWRCLNFHTSVRRHFGLSLYDPTFTQDRNPMAGIYELTELGGQGLLKVKLNIAPDADCPVIGSSPDNYLIAWHSPESVSFTDLHIESSSTMHESLGGAIGFDGSVPQVSAVAPVGGYFAVAFAGTGGPRGPQVRLYDFQGTRSGMPLLLPLSGEDTGPVSASAAENTLFLTYRENASLPTGSGPRRFVRVECGR